MPREIRSQHNRVRKNLTMSGIQALDEYWVQWLDSLAVWTHACTFTCKRYSVRDFPISEEILVDTARHLLRRVNHRYYGKRARRERLIPAVATMGWGLYGDHPHLHFCLESPAGTAFDVFTAVLEEEARKTHWIDRQSLIKQYKDFGWLDYLLDHGTAQLIVPLITPSSSESPR